MMLRLAADVVSDQINLRLAHRERTVTILPRKSGCIRKLVLYPMRRNTLQQLHGLGYGAAGWNHDQNVCMVVNTSNFHGL